MPLKRGVEAMYGMLFDDMKQLEKYKDAPNALLYGKSYREVQIAISEQLLKPLHGEDGLVKLFLSLHQKTSFINLVISDSGFNTEATMLREVYGYNNVALVHLTRPNCSFDEDSREFVDPIKFKYYYKIDNKYDLELFEIQVKRVIKDLGVMINEGS